ncbi:MAG: Fur family transcriptional regulator [Candidatus Saccharimonadales bacterium]
MTTVLDQLRGILKAHNVSVTSARTAVFSTLHRADQPLKNGEIVQLTPTVDRASVYRTLELFSSLGITETTIRGWTPFTELSEPFKPHHHHLICEGCGHVEGIENETLEDVLQLIASRHQFTLEKHLVELTGLCVRCHATPQAA